MKIAIPFFLSLPPPLPSQPSYLDVLHPGGLERVADVLRLRRGLRAPADDAHRLDPLPGLWQLGELVAPAAVDELLEAGELYLLLLGCLSDN